MDRHSRELGGRHLHRGGAGPPRRVHLGLGGGSAGSSPRPPPATPDPTSGRPSPALDPISSAEATLGICQRVLRGVAEADYHKPTVCTDFDVTQLADHLIGSVTFMCAAAGGESGADSVTSPLETRVATAAQAALEAWHVRGLDGEVKVGPHEMPAGAALGILSIDFLVHAWDFAQATGQQVPVSDEVAQHVLGLARQIITPETRGGGSFADPIEAGPDASLLDRLIAFTGRNTHQ